MKAQQGTTCPCCREPITSVTNLTTGQGRICFNPNLYRTGKVCMSILGTWVGPGWNPSHSLSSVLLSIQSLMNDQPYCAHLGVPSRRRRDSSSALDAGLALSR